MVRAVRIRASSAVWLAESFLCEHRRAIQHLNWRDGGLAAVFAVEMGLWRIDDSPPGLRFDVVAAPEGWPRSGWARRPRRGAAGRIPIRELSARPLCRDRRSA